MTHFSRRQMLAGLAAAPVLAISHRSFAQSVTTLEASYSTAAFDKLMAAASDLYAKQTGIRVTYRMPVAANHGEHMKQMLRQAITHDLPDLSFVANNNVAALAARGMAQPLDAFAAKDPNWANVSQKSAVARIGQVDGKLHGLPFQISVPVCMINLELVARAGGDPAKLPQDWPGLIALAHRIAALGKETIGGFFDYGGAWTFQALVTADGGRMATPDGRKVAFDGPEGLHAMNVIGGFSEASVDMSQEQALQAFGSGTVGVLATSNNVMASLEKQAAGRFKIATVAWPMTSPEGRLPAGGRTGLVFTHDPARQAAAWDFLRFMTSPEVQVLVVQATGAIPVDPAIAKPGQLLGQFYADHPNQLAGLERSDRLTGWYSFPGENTVKINDIMIEKIRAVTGRSLSPEDALRSMSRDVQALLPTSI